MKVSPSILTCDFAYVADQFRFVKETGADMMHVDVMDGVFVPNMSFGAPVLTCMRKVTDMFLDVHLMMQFPHRLIPDFIKAGADLINFHVESSAPIDPTLDVIRAAGVKTGLTIKPYTRPEAVFPYLDKLDLVLVMTVEPGFGGQKFMADMMYKVKALREEIDRRGLKTLVEVDGGINGETAHIAAEAGADVAVVGSALFNAADPKALVADIQKL